MFRFIHTIASATALTLAASATADSLLTTAPGPISVAPPKHATNVRAVGVELETFVDLSTGGRFDIDLGDGARTVVVDERKRVARGTALRGSFAGEPDSVVVIAVVDDAVAGYFLPETGVPVRLRYGGPDGTHYLHTIDGEQIPPCACCAGQVGDAEHRTLEWQARDTLGELGLLEYIEGADLDDDTALPAAESNVGCSPGPTVFDVMLVYTPAARVMLGGVAATEAECIGATMLFEQACDACGSYIEVNLVYLDEVDYVEADTIQEDLDALAAGDIDDVHARRDGSSADFVSMVHAGDGAGLGDCDSGPDEPYSVCRWDAVMDNLTLAHELGHNIGMAHNPDDAVVCEPYSYGYGHNFWVPALGENRRTVMAYSVLSGDTRIPFYSSPTCTFMGTATGTATRDNQRVLDERRSTCEDFRLTRMHSWVDFSYNGTEWGSFNQPYDTVAEGVNRLIENAPYGNPVLHLFPGSTSETLTISKPLTIDACGGTVTIGAP